MQTLTTQEVAAQVGTGRTTLLAWRCRYPDFPKPSGKSQRDLAWTKGDVKRIKKWMEKTGRTA